MLFLLISVCLSVAVSVLLKLARRRQLEVTQMVAVNYPVAALLSFAFLWARGTRWRRDNVLAGMALGALNFGNIFCYLKAHVALKDHPSVVFAGMNVGVIVLGALVGAGVFRERLSRVNVAGVALALVAVGCLTYARLAGA